MKPLAPNTLIQNRYLIVHLIGKGGMGEVYLAVDQRLGSAIALKRTFFAGDEMLGTAFEREARILARMRHPALPKVSDHFTENQEQYLVMEHISGDDLAKRLEVSGKPFPVSWVMFWADQLLDALSYLHSHEPPIVHRDIKPQNLKLTDENYIILLDFGLSKSSTGKTHIPSANSKGTGGSTGSVVGYTPHYAPMEQIRGIGTNARSDLYSLAATLYQLVTNCVPPDALTRADALLNGSPDPIVPPHEINPEVPQNVSGVILKGMEVSQERRFSTAREMQRELRQAFSRLQEVMSAQTVAFNAHSEGLGTLGQAPAPNFQPTSQPGQNNSQSQGSSIPKGDEPLDFDATLAFDPGADSAARKQSQIKTEVFLSGGSTSTSERPTSNPTPPPSGNLPQSNDTFGWENNSQGSFNSSPPEGGAQMTVPLVSFENGTGQDEKPESMDADFFTAPAIAQRTESFGQDAAQGNAYNSQPRPVTAEVAPTPAVVRAAPAQKSSTGKAIALLGGLAVFFLLILGVAGAGWYIYTRRSAVATEITPTPTPSPTVEATPVPTPSFESVVETNSANSNTNSDTAGTLPVAPTPTPTVSESLPSGPATQRPTNPVPNPRETQPVAPRNTPVKSIPTPATPKPTPKPKASEAKPVILQ